MADRRAECVRRSSHASSRSDSDPVEIGVALTSFGVLFMMLGVILFFDGALLALGNVRRLGACPKLLRVLTARDSTSLVPVWADAHHLAAKDILFLLTKA